MAEGGGPSSWNPAFMPNSAHETTSPEQPNDALRPTTDIAPSTDFEPHADSSFSNDGDGDVIEGGAMLGASQGTSQVEAVNNAAPQSNVSEDADLPESSTNGQESQSPAKKSQHSSSMSFARTVSHEPNFHDEDDADWPTSQDQDEPDPFKFMAPSNRTNSFPAVPPLVSAAEATNDSLPATQALEVMEEAEAEDEPLTSTGSRHAHSQSIGGDIQGFEGATDEARYAEGVPLIGSSSQDQGDAAVDQKPRVPIDSFDDENDNDDFFSKSQQTDDEPAMPPLERKSTMQVMASLSPELPTKRTALEEALDEEEEDDWLGNGTEETKPDAAGLGISMPEDQTTIPASAPAPEDLAAKWQEAFASDDEEGFLEEDAAGEKKGVDAAAFWGSDDEGFLEDDDGGASAAQPTQPAVVQSNQYTPYPPTTGLSSTPLLGANTTYSSLTTPATPYNSAAPWAGAPPSARPEVNKTESFADKGKSGYSSPYDLPSDLVTPMVKPRKRPSLQQLASAPASSLPPPPSGRTPVVSPTNVAHGAPAGPKTAATPSTAQSGFFEDLPMTLKPRSASRQSNRAPSPALHGNGAPLGPLQPNLGPAPGQMPPPSAAQMQRVPSDSIQPEQQYPGIASLVPPAKINPYATLDAPANSVPPPSGSASRYSPAPPKPFSTSSAPPPASSSRYSPAPTATATATATRSNHGYGPAVTSPIPPAMFPHQPRTSSPLAHFEFNHNKGHTGALGPNGDVSAPDRRTSMSYEPRLNRLPSLPPMREVDEDADTHTAARSLSVSHDSHVNGETSTSPGLPPMGARQTPPPPMGAALSASPRKASRYAPQASPLSSQSELSHGDQQGVPPAAAVDNRRASSTPSPVLSRAAPGHSRVRGKSVTMQMVPPTDGSEHDPLQRWKGVPIFTWGVGGTVATTFPKSVPRYGMNQAVPTILRTPGEVHVKNIKDVAPLSDDLTKFPGPLKGKSKKKETVSWLTAGIESMEQALPEVTFNSQLSHEDKRSTERLLLWKILKVFIEHDGNLEGNSSVEKAVRDILSPGTVTPTAENDALFPASMGSQAAPITAMQADGADVVAMEQIRHHLLRGDREAAVWAAADKRLWGHAMLISHTVSSELYGRVAQEFVRKEVNYAGHSNESIGALYKVLSGNFDDCVDELVPVHARAGLQLLSTATSLNPSINNTDGLDKWRETLTLILSNRSPDDIRGLHALGNLLSSYGRPEAAHVCFLFSRQLSAAGGLDDAKASFVLLGTDHQKQEGFSAKEVEAIQLTEVYEYGLSLTAGPNAAGLPYLSAYKFQHAMVLGEHGFRDKALAYCDAITSAIQSQTRRSPYHHAILEATVEDFGARLKQAPKDGSSGWMSKPSMNKVSDSMWNRFNKFVAGDEAEGGKGAGDENGPFARIATTPTISRSPSVSNFEPYGGSPGYPSGLGAPLSTSVPSRYTPMGAPPMPTNSYEPSSQYAPGPPSLGRSSSEAQRSPYDFMSAAAPATTGYAPQPVAAAPVYGLQPSPNIQSANDFAPSEPDAANQGYQPPMYGYEAPTSSGDVPPEESANAGNASASGGYEPPAAGGYEAPSFQPYGYEPPTYQPDAVADEDDEPKQKKKSFMDDDDDGFASTQPKEKSKEERERENQALFQKAVEEDAKRAAEKAAQAAPKKGWGFGGWFGGKKEAEIGSASPNKPVRAKLGEQSSFVYDPDLKRWINKKPGAENAEAPKAAPPPPKAMRAATSTPPPPGRATPPPMAGRASAPPPARMGGTPPPPMPMLPPDLAKQPSMESIGGAPAMGRSVSNMSNTSLPPSRPTTSMSNASSIDDLIGAAGPRRPGAKKARKSGRYVDVMSK